MFGYVRYDLSYLYVKDLTLYRSLYCGLCKGIGKCCGLRARAGLTYDVTMLSALLHNIAGIDVKIERQHCFEHFIRRRPIAVVDELTEELGALNTIFVYYKLTDDILDGGRGKGRRMFFKKGFRRAKKRYPALVEIVERHLREQEVAERQNASPDMAADPSARMLAALSDEILGDKATEATSQLFYCLGKWVYLIDALDDYDKDLKKKAFNPFYAEYGSASKEILLKEKGEEVQFLFDSIFFGLREQMELIHFRFNRDLIDNVVLRGLPRETERVMRGEQPQKMQGKI